MGIFQRFFGRQKQPDTTRYQANGHLWCCECQQCLDECMERHNYENYTSKGRPVPTQEEQEATQREYNRIAAKIGASSGVGGMEDHKRIVRIMSGEEAEPE